MTTNDADAHLLSSRSLAAGEGWSLDELLCRAGPGDRPFEERHGAFSIAAVVEGQFAYRGERGSAYLAPGALLTGNAGRCFCCAHEHGVGDRCVSLNFSREIAEEASSGITGRAAFSFAAPSLPPGDGALPIVTAFEAFAAAKIANGGEDLLWATLERVVGELAGRGGKSIAPNAREMRGISAAISAIDDDPTREHSLAELARVARISRFHFLRAFRRATGATPHQYLIQARMRRAAARLKASREPITAIALDSGFGDLSTFNRRFRAVFGASPRQYRASV